MKASASNNKNNFLNKVYYVVFCLQSCSNSLTIFFWATSDWSLKRSKNSKIFFTACTSAVHYSWRSSTTCYFVLLVSLRMNNVWSKLNLFVKIQSSIHYTTAFIWAGVPRPWDYSIALLCSHQNAVFMILIRLVLCWISWIYFPLVMSFIQEQHQLQVEIHCIISNTIIGENKRTS